MTATQTNRASLSVMLIVPDAAAAISWYKTALGAADLWNLGSVAGLQLRGAPFMLHEAVPGRKTEQSPVEVGLTTTRIEVFVDNPGQLIEQAAQAGATEVQPLVSHEAPWGRISRAASPIRSGTDGPSETGHRYSLTLAEVVHESSAGHTGVAGPHRTAAAAPGHP